MKFKSADELANFMSEVTNERFEVIDAVPGFPPDAGVAWYLLSLGDPSKTAYAHKVWDENGRITIESMYLGNTTEWLEIDYGEREAAESIFPEGGDLQSIRKLFQEKYPIEDRRLTTYQAIVEGSSVKHGINLSIRCQGSDLGATFFIDATIDLKSIDNQMKTTLVKRNLTGLQEAWEGIKSYERNLRANRPGRPAMKRGNQGH